MVLYNIPDIRLFWSTDPRFLSQFTDGKVTTFKPYSKFPPCYKDISLWVDVPSSDEASKPAHSFHENDFCDIVRDTAGDLVEDVKKVRAWREIMPCSQGLRHAGRFRSMNSCIPRLADALCATESTTGRWTGAILGLRPLLSQI